MDFQSVYIVNILQNCDTIICGSNPSILLSWLPVINKNAAGSSGAFSMQAAYPNPSSGTTKVTVSIRNKEHISMVLANKPKQEVAKIIQTLDVCIHTFEITTEGERLYVILVF